MIKILLYNPPRYFNNPVVRLYRSEYVYSKIGVVPPMDFAYLCSALKGRDDIEIKILDSNGENLNLKKTKKNIKKFSPDIIVVKATVSTINHDLKLLEEYKNENKDVKIILSSRTCIGLEHYILKNYQFLDGIARGEIDSFTDLPNILKNTKIKGLYTKSSPSQEIRVVEDLNINPIPDINELPNIWYTGYHIPPYCKSGYFLTASRGCFFKCTFCPTGGIKGINFYLRKRNPINVIQELNILNSRGIKDFYFFDEIFTLPNHAEIISKKILEEKLDLLWRCEGKVNFINNNMLEIMKKAGCEMIFYGLESADNVNLNNVKKGQNLNQVRKAILLTKRNDIKVSLYIMLGLPNDSWKSFWKTFIFLLKSNPDSIRFNFLAPYPGTEIFEEMKARGLIDVNYANFDRHLSKENISNDITIRTEYLSEKELRLMEILFKKIFFYKLRDSV
jgi:anaerobic magnesium-protoporphyrin IX monomethyl ester cyclase